MTRKSTTLTILDEGRRTETGDDWFIAKRTYLRSLAANAHAYKWDSSLALADAQSASKRYKKLSCASQSPYVRTADLLSEAESLLCAPVLLLRLCSPFVAGLFVRPALISATSSLLSHNT